MIKAKSKKKYYAEWVEKYHYPFMIFERNNNNNNNNVNIDNNKDKRNKSNKESTSNSESSEYRPRWLIIKLSYEK